MSEWQNLQKQVQDFCEERHWDQFHSPKELAIDLVTEAAELLEIFKFKSEEECLQALDEKSVAIADELADCLYVLLRFSQKYEIDLLKSFQLKMQKNCEKYPVAKARGSNKKYTEL